MLIFGAKMPHLFHFRPNKNFPPKKGCIAYMCLLKPDFMQIRKNTESILRKKCYKRNEWRTDGCTDEAKIIENHYMTLFGYENQLGWFSLKKKWPQFLKLDSLEILLNTVRSYIFIKQLFSDEVNNWTMNCTC